MEEEEVVRGGERGGRIPEINGWVTTMTCGLCVYGEDDSFSRACKSEHSTI